jgi:hypothetical protein
VSNARSKINESLTLKFYEALIAAVSSSAVPPTGRTPPRASARAMHGVGLARPGQGGYRARLVLPSPAPSIGSRAAENWPLVLP